MLKSGAGYLICPVWKASCEGDRRDTKKWGRQEKETQEPAILCPAQNPGPWAAPCLPESCRTGRERWSPSPINERKDPATDLDCVH